MTFDSSEAIARRWANGSGTRIYAIDGRSGAGKSTLARKIREQIKAANPSVRVILIEVENHIPGWNGLVDGVQNIADDILEPFLATLALAAGTGTPRGGILPAVIPPAAAPKSCYSLGADPPRWLARPTCAKACGSKLRKLCAGPG